MTNDNENDRDTSMPGVMEKEPLRDSELHQTPLFKYVASNPHTVWFFNRLCESDFRDSMSVDHLCMATLTKREVVEEVLRDLQDMGVVSFVTSHNVFKWKCNPRSVGESARGLIEGPVPFNKCTNILHTFMVRKGINTTMVLPVDLTEREARRLADFIRCLPFPEDNPDLKKVVEDLTKIVDGQDSAPSPSQNDKENS